MTAQAVTTTLFPSNINPYSVLKKALELELKERKILQDLGDDTKLKVALKSLGYLREESIEKFINLKSPAATFIENISLVAGYQNTKDLCSKIGLNCTKAEGYITLSIKHAPTAIELMNKWNEAKNNGIVYGLHPDVKIEVAEPKQLKKHHHEVDISLLEALKKFVGEKLNSTGNDEKLRARLSKIDGIRKDSIEKFINNEPLSNGFLNAVAKKIGYSDYKELLYNAGLKGSIKDGIVDLEIANPDKLKPYIPENKNELGGNGLDLKTTGTQNITGNHAVSEAPEIMVTVTSGQPVANITQLKPYDAKDRVSVGATKDNGYNVSIAFLDGKPLTYNFTDEVTAKNMATKLTAAFGNMSSMAGGPQNKAVLSDLFAKRFYIDPVNEITR